MAALRPRLSHKPRLPPKPKQHTPNTITTHTPPATTGDEHTSSLKTTEGFLQTRHGHSSREKRQKEERQKIEWKTKLQVDVGRSEPDGSETDEGGKAEQSVRSATLPLHHTDEKHCHCICHLPRPGMRLMWVPLDDRSHAGQNINNGHLQGDEKPPAVEDTGQRRRTSNVVECTSVKSPTMPQCYSCRSFRLHHSPQEDLGSEDVYESMEVFFSSLPTEEPIYLQLQPSDHSSPTPPTRPIPPPRPLSTLHERQKEKWSTQLGLGYVLSPRGGRPPIRAHTNCERGSGSLLQKPKTEDKKKDENKDTKEDKKSGDQQQVICDGDSGSDQGGRGDYLWL